MTEVWTRDLGARVRRTSIPNRPKHARPPTWGAVEVFIPYPPEENHMTDWFLQHAYMGTPQIGGKIIVHHTEGDEVIWTVPVEWDIEFIPLSEILATYRPKPKGRWHLCQARKQLPLAERPAKKNSMWRKFRRSVARTLPTTASKAFQLFDAIE